MKKLLVILALIGLATPAFAVFYDVAGKDSRGNPVSGEIEADENGGSGSVTIAGDDDEIGIDVLWVGEGRLEGVDKDGVKYKLKVQ